MSCLPPKGTEPRTLHILGNRHDNTKRVPFKWTGRGWETPGTGFETVPTAMATLGWHYIERTLCEGCKPHPPVGSSKLCVICSGWKEAAPSELENLRILANELRRLEDTIEDLGEFGAKAMEALGEFEIRELIRNRA